MHDYPARRDRVSPQSNAPLYQQIYQLLRDQIRHGAWHPGDLFPSETSLMEKYDVSRATVRQALEELVADGLIYRRRGRGTFVSAPSVEQNLVRIVSFTEDMRRRGLKPGTALLGAELVPATEAIATKLQIEEGEELARIERLRLADGESMSVEVSYLVHRYCPGVLEADYTQHSLRQILEQKYGIRMTRAEQTIQAVAASRTMARHLSIEARAPLLFIERTTYSEYDTPVEFLRIYHRGDRYTLHNELRG